MEENKQNIEDKQSKYMVVRILLIIVGVLSLILGTIGIFLPVLPTTPLYLLTSYCFMRGSKRFNDWFTSTKLYKKYVSGFVEYKAMSIFGVSVMLIFVSSMLILAMCMVPNVLPMAIVLNLLIVVKYGYFITKVRVVSKEELLEIKAKKEVVV
ncbi:MAG: YbaN family protein [bacterium]